MAKKITVAMLKNEKELDNISGEEFKEICESMCDNALRKITKFRKQGLSEFPVEEIGIFEDGNLTRDLAEAIGLLVLFMFKGQCTPAAWKYVSTKLNEYLMECNEQK